MSILSSGGACLPSTMGRSSFSVSSSSSMPNSKHRSSNSWVVNLCIAESARQRGRGGAARGRGSAVFRARGWSGTHLWPRASKSLYLSTEIVGIVGSAAGLAEFSVLEGCCRRGGSLCSGGFWESSEVTPSRRETLAGWQTWHLLAALQRTTPLCYSPFLRALTAMIRSDSSTIICRNFYI